jgi:hypothetical protein
MLRQENGGAREEGLPKRLCSANRTGAISTCPQTSSLRPHDTGKINAGNPPALPIRASDLSLTACLTTRFDGPDSSISWRIACRSSVAEITGNSSIRTQPKSTKERIPPKHRQSLAQTDSRRHIQMAGNANISQRRLSANSIRCRESRNHYLRWEQSCKISNTSQCNRKGVYAGANRFVPCL